MLWKSQEEAGHCYREALRNATVAVGNQSEVEVAVGTGDPFEASEALLEMGLDLAIVKRGPERRARPHERRRLRGSPDTDRRRQRSRRR